MAGSSLIDVCRFNPTLGGTTDWTYSTAVTGYQSPAAAGVVNGAQYSYRSESSDLSQWEIGIGTYNTSTGVLSRTTVSFNSSGGTSKINFTTAPQVAIVALAEDLPWLGAASNTFTGSMSIGAGNAPNIAQSFSGQNSLFGFYNSVTAANSHQAEIAGFDGIISSTGASTVVTISLGSPAVISLANHNFPVGAQIVLATTGTLYTGLVAGTTYYLSTAGANANSFQVADTLAHALAGTNSINTSGTQSGVQSINTTTLAYKMARAFATTVNSGSGSGWGLNPVVNIGAGGTIRGGIGIEMDLNNNWGNYTGSPSNPYAANYYATGTNMGGYSSFAYGAEFGANNSPMWQAGYHAGPAGNQVFNTATFWDETNSPIILKATGSHTDGVNISGASFSGNAWHSPGATIDGSGNILSNSIAVGGGACPAGTSVYGYVNAPNTFDFVQRLENDQAGSGSVLLGLTATAFTASAETRASKAGIGLTRTNPQGVGTFALYNRTSTDTNSFTSTDAVLSWNSSNVMQFNSSAQFVANGTVATTMTSLGPTGSHATIQEWLTFKNAAGTVRYVPLY